MSKRRGDFVTLDDLLDEIGVDATRFFMLQRSHDRTLDLDVELARQQSAENPVYYVQYAHARIASMLGGCGGAGGRGAGRGVDWGAGALHPSERELIKKLVAFPERSPRPPSGAARTGSPATRSSSRRSSPRSTATAGWSGRRPEAVESFRIALSVAAQRTIALALGLLGVSAPGLDVAGRALAVERARSSSSRRGVGVGRASARRAGVAVALPRSARRRHRGSVIASDRRPRAARARRQHVHRQVEAVRRRLAEHRRAVLRDELRARSAPSSGPARSAR